MEVITAVSVMQQMTKMKSLKIKKVKSGTNVNL